MAINFDEVTVKNARSYGKAVVAKFEDLAVCIYYDGATPESQFEARRSCAMEYVKGQISIVHESFFNNYGAKKEKLEFLNLVLIELQKLKRI